MLAQLIAMGFVFASKLTNVRKDGTHRELQSAHIKTADGFDFYIKAYGPPSAAAPAATVAPVVQATPVVDPAAQRIASLEAQVAALIALKS